VRHATSTLRLLAALAAVAAAPACDSAVPIDGEGTLLYVDGDVMGSSGSPVIGAIVDVAWRPAVCGGELTSGLSDTTDASGTFSVPMFEWGTFSLACVRIAVTPPEASGLLGQEVEYDSIPLSPKDGPDTLDVHLTLSAAPALLVGGAPGRRRH